MKIYPLILIQNFNIIIYFYYLFLLFIFIYFLFILIYFLFILIQFSVFFIYIYVINMSFVRESFTLMGGAKMSGLNSVFLLLLVVVMQLALVWFARLLWNTYLTKCVTIVKPIKDLWQMLAIFVLLKILF